jgi:hypothetical protein
LPVGGSDGGAVECRGLWMFDCEVWDGEGGGAGPL